MEVLGVMVIAICKALAGLNVSRHQFYKLGRMMRSLTQDWARRIEPVPFIASEVVLLLRIHTSGQIIIYATRLNDMFFTFAIMEPSEINLWK